MTTIALSLAEMTELATRAFTSNGCDEANTQALVRTVVTAERDGSHSHGLFRVPGYIASLRSGKVNGKASPRISHKSPVIIAVHGEDGFAPLAIERAVEPLSAAARTFGVAVCAMTHTHHFAALWPETEALAARGLVGMACVCHLPVVAPFGGREPLFGTNPISIAWPRPGQDPVVLDMATAAMARGEVSIAARDGRSVPLGTGLDSSGAPTTDPHQILNGVLLPFGGHKGSALALMVELLAAGAIGERFSFEAANADNRDGGPPRGGECCSHSHPSCSPDRAGPSIASSSSNVMQPSPARGCPVHVAIISGNRSSRGTSMPGWWRTFAHCASSSASRQAHWSDRLTAGSAACPYSSSAPRAVFPCGTNITG